MTPKTFDQIKWRFIYGDECAELPRTLPFWASDPETNVHHTVEWLARNGRKNTPPPKTAADSFWEARKLGERLGYWQVKPEPVTLPLKDGWFRQEWTDGRTFYHVCDAAELLKYRRMYEANWGQHPQVRFNLWLSLWSVCGRDGVYYSKWDDKLDTPAEGHQPYTSSDFRYQFKCSKCIAPMHKGMIAWIKLQSLNL